MATTFTTEMLTALNVAIATGVKDVYYGDKRVSYRSINEMLAVRALMEKELGLSLPTRRTAIFCKNL